MSQVVIVVPAPLRRFVDNGERVAVEAATVHEALLPFTAGCETLHGHLFEESGRLRRFVRVFVDGHSSNTGGGLSALLG